MSLTQNIARQNLSQIVSNIRAAEVLLLQSSRATSDPATLIKINTEYQALDSYLSQILNAQATADDQAFESAINALKLQISSLQQEESHIKAIVADVATAAQILGYISQAISVVAML